MRPAPLALLAAGSLVAGFAVADLTGVRALGGVVLIAAALVCGRAWWRALGAAPAAGLLVLYALAFAVSHPLARVTGAWPAVLLVAAAVGFASWMATTSARVSDAA